MIYVFWSTFHFFDEKYMLHYHDMARSIDISLFTIANISLVYINLNWAQNQVK